MGDTLDDQVRRADPDRWLSSRFVDDPGARADLIALYAFEAELMAIPARVNQPMLAEMRYTWWSEQLDGVFAGVARKGHPVLETLTEVVGRHGLERGAFDFLIEAHIGRMHGAPHDLDAFYVGPMQVAARCLGNRDDAVVGRAALTWGLMQTGRHDEALAALTVANRDLSALPIAAFPAVAHATLARRPEAGALERRLGLTVAVLRGRL